MDADPHHEEANLEMEHSELEEKDQLHQQSKSSNCDLQATHK